MKLSLDHLKLKFPELPPTKWEMSYEQFENDRDIDEGRKCVVLWRTVINQALRDVFNIRSKNPTQDCEKRVAISWFLDCGRNFRAVCQWAQVDPQNLRDYFIKRYEKQVEREQRLLDEEKKRMKAQ
jgi:hypothetical protein